MLKAMGIRAIRAWHVSCARMVAVLGYEDLCCGRRFVATFDERPCAVGAFTDDDAAGSRLPGCEGGRRIVPIVTSMRGAIFVHQDFDIL